MMFFNENKKLILGAVAGFAIWMVVVFMFIQSNWSLQAQKQRETEENKKNWDGYFTAKSGEKLLPKTEAEAAIKDSNDKLATNLEQLRNIEFGTAQLLRAYSEAAAGSGDKKSFFISLRSQLEQKSNTQWFIKVPADLDLVSRAEDPVSLNLLRLAIVDHFLADCKASYIQRVTKIKYEMPSVIQPPERSDAKEAKFDSKDDAAAPKKSGKGAPAAPAPEAQEKLIQFPVRITVIGPERTVAQLLFEVQKPVMNLGQGYFCLHSVKVEINDAATGTVRATLGIAALLTEKVVNELQIKLKSASGDDDHRGPSQPERDLDRY
jgi:hypothetical protein